MAHEEFIQKVKSEVVDSNPEWLKKIPKGTIDHVPTTSNRFWANKTERDLVQQMGASFGCHTCNKDIADANQRFIVDHIPPKEWMKSTSSLRYFPHCDVCAAKQSSIVRLEKNSKIHKIVLANVKGFADRHRLVNAKTELVDLGIDLYIIKLLCGGSYSLSIDGRYGDPNSEERLAINRKGRCHSCNSKQATFIYHADHCPPRELGMTSWFPKLMAKLGSPLDDSYFFRPQCPSCSHKQGQRCKKLVGNAIKIASEVGIIRY